MVKYAPRKVYIRESGGYVELSYTEFCRCRESDQTYMDKLFIPIQGCLLEVVREQYTDFYRDKERWRYLQKLDTKNRLLSLDGFTDSEGNPLKNNCIKPGLILLALIFTTKVPNCSLLSRPLILIIQATKSDPARLPMRLIPQT